MRRIKFYCNTTALPYGIEEIVEFDDDTTNVEITEVLAEWTLEKADATWSEI